jgi:hypothetical protein
VKLTPKKREEISSATIPQTLALILTCSAICALTLEAQPGWWTSSGAVTDTNNTPATNSIVVNMGQVKQFTARAAQEMNATLTNAGGAGPALSNVVYTWQTNYAANGWNATNPKPSDKDAANVGQLKYIGYLVWNQLVSAGYTNSLPAWLASSNAADYSVATIGQLKTVFNFDPTVAANSVTGLTASASNGGEIDLSWTPPTVNNATSLEVLASTDGGNTWTNVGTLTNTALTSFAVQGLSVGQAYQFQVVAGNNTGYSAAASTSSQVTAPVYAPSGSSATLGASNSVSLTWSQGNTNGVTGYTIQQSIDQGQTWTQVGSASAGQTSKTLSNLSGAMDTSEFEVKANGGTSVSLASSPITPTASATTDTDIDGTMDNVDGWAGFTDPTQEKLLAPPRLPNPTYVAVTISTIPNNYVIDFVNHQGQAVVHDPSQPMQGLPQTGGGTFFTYYPYYFWDKGATTPVALPPIQIPDPSHVPNTKDRLVTGLGDNGTVIGVDRFFQQNIFNNWQEEAWRWSPGMTNVQYLADYDQISSIPVTCDWFSTIPFSISTFNSTEKITAFHTEQQNGSLAYTETWTTANSGTSSPQVYSYPGFSNVNDQLIIGLEPSGSAGALPQGSGHESRIPAADNGNGTIIGFGAHMDNYVNVDGSGSVDTNLASLSGNSLTNPLDLVGEAFIVNGSYRQWINGKLAGVNSTGQVLGLQYSPAPSNLLGNAKPYVIFGFPGQYRSSGFYPFVYSPLLPYPYIYGSGSNGKGQPAPSVFSMIPIPYSYSSSQGGASVPTIWIPQPATGPVTSYTPVTLTMPQTGLSFKGDAGLFLNKNLQIAGGIYPTTSSATDAPFLWQNYQYHKLSDFFPGLGNYSAFQVMGLDDNSTITAIATPSTPANSNQQIVQLFPAEIAVDANRDGTIVLQNDAANPVNAGLPVDKTTQAHPFRFWVNDGQNTGEDQAPLTGSAITSHNYSLGQINYKGDLENFARLWMYTKGLNTAIQSGEIKVGLKWENVTSGTPAINVYQAVENNGGTMYLSSDTTAGQQIAGNYGTAVAKVIGTSPVVLPTSVFANLSDSSPKTYFLFEGAGAGVGKLTMVFLKSDGVTEIGEGGQVYMSLKTVTDMFEQAQVTPPGQTDIAAPYYSPANGNWNASTATNDSNGPPSYAPGTTPTTSWTDTTSSNFEHPLDETKQFLLFVHGWNVTNGRYTEQSGECFKRLWWQGYKGIFAAIRWPGDLTGADQSSWWSTAENALDYFEIEYRGFKYGQSVKQYTDHFNAVGYTVGVVGHSMGNIVSSEALKSGGNFTYVLMDGAVSARCYDTSSSLELTGTTFNPPDLYTSGGYGGYFSGLSGGPTSFYNAQDPALQAWATGNVLLKGETDANGVSYVFTGGVGVQLQYILSQAHPQPLYRDVFANGVTNYHESMTMYAVTRTAAVGIESVGGSVTSLDMQSDFPGAASHSPQFDYDIQHGPMTFYKKVLSGLDFPLNP